MEGPAIVHVHGPGSCRQPEKIGFHVPHTRMWGETDTELAAGQVDQAAVDIHMKWTAAPRTTRMGVETDTNYEGGPGGHRRPAEMGCPTGTSSHGEM